MSTVSATAAAKVAGPERARLALRLGAVVTAVAGVQAALAAAIPSPWIVPDELIYSELAKSVAAGHLPAIRGVTTLSYGIAYPILLSPAWLVGDTITAYTVAHVINALLMSIAAVPAYLLARRFVSGRSAFVVAVFSVLLPSMVYTSSLLVENALYPAFLFALLTMVRALERPTPGRQVAALCVIAFAFEVKALAIVLVPAYLCTIWLTQRGDTRRRFRPTFWLVAVAALLAGVAATLSSGSPTRVVGAYSVVLSHVDPLTVPWWFLLHLAELAVAVGVIPFAATVLVLIRARRSGDDPRAKLFASLLVPVLIWTLAAVAAFASWPSAGAAGVPATTARVYERGTFELLPLFLIGFAFMLESGLPGPGRRGLVAVGAAAALPVVLPISSLRFNANFQAPALVPWLSLDLVGWRWVALALAAAVAATLVIARPSARAPRLAWLVVGMWFVVGTMFTYGSTLTSSRDARGIGGGASRDWIDATVGRSAQVAVLWREPGSGVQHPDDRHRLVWVNEFFNRSVGRVYVLGGDMPYGLPVTHVEIANGVVVSKHAAVVRSPYALAPCDLVVAAPAVATDSQTGMTVYRTAGPIRMSGSDDSRCQRRR